MSGLGLQSSLAQYKVVSAQYDRFEANFTRTPQIKRDIAHFTEKAPAIDSVDKLLKDRASLQFVLASFQLEDKVDAKALIRKIITQDPDDSASLVNRLSDPRYKSLAVALQGLNEGTAIFKTKKTFDAIISSYKTNQFEKAEGEQNPGLREAFYFKREIAGVNNIFQILSSKPLSQVVRVALGLPEEFSTLDAKTQARTIAKRLDITKFKDPNFVNRFIDRYLANTDAKANSTSTSPYVGLLQSSQGSSLSTFVFNPGSGGILI